MPWSQRDVDWVAARLLPEVYDINQRIKYDRNTRRLEALHGEIMKFRITEPTFFLHKNRQPGESLEFPVGPHKNTLVGGHGLVRVPQFEEIRETKSMSVIDRLKAKALEAKSISANAIRDFESDLDGLIAERSKLDQKRVEAVAPHKEVIAGIYGELDGLKQAMDLLSNGGPPLGNSGGSAPK